MMVRKVELPDDLIAIVEAHNIELFLGHDDVFEFLKKRSELAEIICASENIFIGTRFIRDDGMGLNETGQILFKYTSKKIAELCQNDPRPQLLSENLKQLPIPIIDIVSHYVGSRQLEETAAFKAIDSEDAPERQALNSEVSTEVKPDIMNRFRLWFKSNVSHMAQHFKTSDPKPR